MDWGLGSYETIARQLQPGSIEAVARCRPRPGEVIVDLGCGSGNATVLLANAGASVIAVDPTPRLLDVAEQRAREHGIEASFKAGSAESIPVADASADALVSVFAVIFSPDPPAAAAEIARVLTPAGRAVFAAWIPEGPIFRVASLRREAMANAGIADTSPPPFPWFDNNAVTNLFAPFDLKPSTSRCEMTFTAASVEEYVSREFEVNPLTIDAKKSFASEESWEELRRSVVRSLGQSNEDTSAFAVTSPYAIVELSRVDRAGPTP
jgi:ubiquinone/menaquinone biosynthesis C-methylase UbiE